MKLTKDQKKRVREYYKLNKAAWLKSGEKQIPSYKQFERYLIHEAENMLAEEISQRQIARFEDTTKTYYVGVRVAHLAGHPLPRSVQRPCMQCRELVNISGNTVKIADSSKGIVCDVCVPEIKGNGMSFEQIVAEEAKHIL